MKSARDELHTKVVEVAHAVEAIRDVDDGVKLHQAVVAADLA